ncbi:MAG: hypothetical protein JSV25_14845 [Spirochaetota bacterium]|nr:MAG: hypothetical protein JSV25_14845 [Spirochaetota bacterium]
MLKTKTHKYTLGQIFAGSGLITIDELNEALEIQKSTDQKLGQILLSMDSITPEELILALKYQELDEE